MNNKVKQLVGLAVTTATMTPMVTPVHAHAESTASTTTVSLKKEGVEARQGTQVIEGISEEAVETPVMVLAEEEVITEEVTINVNPAFHKELEAITMMNLVEAQGKVDQANKEMEEAKLRDEQLQQELNVANENLEKAEEDVIVAQEAYDKAVAESEGIDTSVLEQVEAELAQAKAELDSAQADLENKQAELNTSLANQERLQAEYTATIEQKSALEGQLTALQGQLAEQNTVVANQQAVVDSLGVSEEQIEEYNAQYDTLMALTAQRDALVAECSALEGQIAGVDAQIQQIAGGVADSQAYVDQLTTEIANLEGVLPTYKQTYDEKLAITTQEQSNYQARLAEKQEADRKVAEAKTNLDSASKNLEQAQKNLDQANKNAIAGNEAIKKAEADLKKAETQYNLGSAGFFKELADKGDADAKQAYNIIMGHAKQDGQQAGKDYSKYTNIGAKHDTTNLENMKYAVDRLNMVNEYRKKNHPNLNTLRVSSSMMAIAQWQTNASRDYIGHSQAYNVGENLAWGYSNPFTGWYDAEREEYLNGNHNFYEVGHYLNIIDADYDVMGYAYTDGAKTYGTAWGQSFIGDWSKYAKGSTSVSNYQNKFNSYYNRVKGNLEKAKKALEEAKKNQTAGGNKTQEQINAEKALKEAQTAYNNAVAQHNAQVQAQTTAQKNVDTAKVTYEKAKAESDKAHVEWVNVQNTIADKKAEKEGIEKEIADKTAGVDALMNQKAQLSAQLAEKTGEKNAKIEEVTKQEAIMEAIPHHEELRVLRVESDKQKALAEDVNNTEKKLQDTLDKSEGLIEELNASIDDVEAKTSAFMESAGVYKEKNQIHNDLLDKYLADKKLYENYLQAKEDLETAQKNVEDLKAEIENKTADRKDLSNRMAELEQIRDRAMERVKELENIVVVDELEKVYGSYKDKAEEGYDTAVVPSIGGYFLTMAVAGGALAGLTKKRKRR